MYGVCSFFNILCDVNYPKSNLSIWSFLFENSPAPKLCLNWPNTPPVKSADSRSGRSARSSPTPSPWPSSPGSACGSLRPDACRGKTWLPGGSAPPAGRQGFTVCGVTWTLAEEAFCYKWHHLLMNSFLFFTRSNSDNAPFKGIVDPKLKFHPFTTQSYVDGGSGY